VVNFGLGHLAQFSVCQIPPMQKSHMR